MHWWPQREIGNGGVTISTLEYSFKSNLHSQYEYSKVHCISSKIKKKLQLISLVDAQISLTWYVNGNNVNKQKQSNQDSLGRYTDFTTNNTNIDTQ